MSTELSELPVSIITLHQTSFNHSTFDTASDAGVHVQLDLANNRSFNTAEAHEHQNIVWDFFIPKDNLSLLSYCTGTVKDIGEYVASTLGSDNAKIALAVSTFIGLVIGGPTAAGFGMTQVFASKSACVNGLGSTGMALAGIALPPSMTTTGISVCALFNRISQEKDEVVNARLTELVQRAKHKVNLLPHGGEVVSIQPSSGSLSQETQKHVESLKKCLVHFNKNEFQEMVTEFKRLKQNNLPIEIEEREEITGTKYKITVELAKQTG